MSEVITIFGSITEDKKLRAVLTAEYFELLKRNPNRRVIMTVELMPLKATMLQEVYFKKAVLPCLQKGFRDTGDDMTLSDTEMRVKDLCPATSGINPEEKLSKEQYRMLIDWSIRLCAEQFGIVVPEPGEDI